MEEDLMEASSRRTMCFYTKTIWFVVLFEVKSISSFYFDDFSKGYCTYSFHADCVILHWNQTTRAVCHKITTLSGFPLFLFGDFSDQLMREIHEMTLGWLISNILT